MKETPTQGVRAHLPSAMPIIKRPFYYIALYYYIRETPCIDYPPGATVCGNGNLKRIRHLHTYIHICLILSRFTAIFGQRYDHFRKFRYLIDTYLSLLIISNLNLPQRNKKCMQVRRELKYQVLNLKIVIFCCLKWLFVPTIGLFWVIKTLK